MARPINRTEMASRLERILNDYLSADLATPTKLVAIDKQKGEHVGKVTLTPKSKPAISGELRHLNPASAVSIEALIARGMMRLSEQRGPKLIVIAVPRLSDGIMTELREELNTLALQAQRCFGKQQLAWIVFSANGGRLIHIPQWRITDARSDERSVRWREDVPISTKRFAFTDSNQVVLKYLLYAAVYAENKNMNEGMWGGTRNMPADVNEISRATGIGKSSIYRLMQDLWNRKIAKMKSVEITGWTTILRDWIEQSRLRSSNEWIPIKPLYENKATELYGKKDVTQWLRLLQQKTAKKKTAVQILQTGFWALKHHKLTAITGDYTKTILVASQTELGRLITESNVQACHVDEAWCLIGVASQRRSTFYGAIDNDGIFVEDAWQAALDVTNDPNRGYEQAIKVADHFGFRIL